MTDGLSSYRSDPMAWAVGTVLEGNVERDGRSADELVENVWEFIVACFEDERIPAPDREALIRNVKRILETK